MDDFKEFVRGHPLLKYEVRDQKLSWQNIYEEWDLLGGNDPSWEKYAEKKEEVLKSVKGQETLRNLIDYVKKINPDNVSKTLNNVGKITSLLTGITTGGKTGSRITGDPLFDKKFDDWY